MKKWMKIALVGVAIAAVLTVAFLAAPRAPEPALAPITTAAEYTTGQNEFELGMPPQFTTTTTANELYSGNGSITQQEIPVITTATAATTLAATVPPGQPHVTLSINAQQAYQNPQLRRPNRNPPMPPGGVILAPVQVSFTPGETVFDLLLRETRARGIHMEHVNNPLFNSAYIRGINNLYEFDFGELSGWVYRVNGVFLGMGVSAHTLQPGDVVELIYTLEMVTIN
ncbi:MAG: DUF4430 domain-containing protein [Oscillospiraceae bacterium]|nr:DUF4430 domain-containing protein [Oscillospiraceae bacterium]